MHLVRLVYILFVIYGLHFAFFVHAQSTSSSSSSRSRSVSSTSASSPSPSPSRRSSTARPHSAASSTNRHSIQILPTTAAIPHVSGFTQHRPPIPTRTRPPEPPSTTLSIPASGPRQKPIVIFFEVLLGLLGFGLILGLLRCCHNYRKTPRRDPIAVVMNRYRLQREMEELQRNTSLPPRSSLREPPPPPYVPPPSYSEVHLPSTARPGVPEGSNHTGTAPASPAITPPSTDAQFISSSSRVSSTSPPTLPNG